MSGQGVDNGICPLDEKQMLPHTQIQQHLWVGLHPQTPSRKVSQSFPLSMPLALAGVSHIPLIPCPLSLFLLPAN